MVEFKKYEKITNSYDSKHVRSVKMAMLDNKVDDLWLVTEKIHGANFACYVKPNEDYMDDTPYLVQYASRNNLLSEAESDAFYNFQSIKSEITEKMIELYQACYNSDATINEIIVYGELFGGTYEHPDVKKVNQSRVQKGVQYCPDLHFKVFDIFLKREGANSSYLNPSHMNYMCHEVKVDRIVPRFHGTLDECLDYQNDFESDIHTDYQLPKVSENVCEGVVIKPVQPFYDHRGNRAIFKNKNDKFKEVAGERKNKVRQPIEYTDEDKEQFELVDRYVTMNRLNNLESKIGELEGSSQIGEFMKGLSIDIIEDIKFETDVELNKRARGHLSKAVKTLIMEKLTTS